MSTISDAFHRIPSFFDPDENDESIKVLQRAFDRGWLHPGCVTPTIQYPVDNRYSSQYIDHGRNLIYQSMVERLRANGSELVGPHLTTLSASDLQFVANRYFQLFIGYTPANIVYQIGTSKKQHIGECTTIISSDHTRHAISISAELIMSCFQSPCSLELNGATVNDRIALLQVAIEHEIVHCIINDRFGLPLCNDKVYKEHGLFFRSLSRALFGHTNAKGLILINSCPGKLYKVSDIVSFQHYNKVISGTVTKINAKTVIVSVVSDQGEEELYRVTPDKLLDV